MLPLLMVPYGDVGFSRRCHSFFGWISDVLDGRGFSLAAFDDVC